MNRREFMKTVSASGMVLVSPVTLTGRAQAADLTPVGQYFVFAHLGGGWEPTTFCNPKGNEIRGNINPNARNAGSPVNRYPASSIRKAADVYAGTADISEDMTYAPYLGTFNQEGADGIRDDGSANQGLTMQHIRQILSGTISGNTLIASSSTAWLEDAAAIENVRNNAKAILEEKVTRVDIVTAGIRGDLVDRDLAINGDNTMNSNLFMYDAFVCLHADNLRVLNGVDNRTNSHSTGTTYADTGTMAMGYPDFSALYAAVQGAERPMAWMTDGGGNSQSAGLVASSGASSANIFNIIADPTDGDTNAIDSYLNAARDQRKALQKENENLPLRRQFQDQLYLVREQGVEFSAAAAELDNPPAGTPAAAVKADSNSGRRNHMRYAVAGFATGMASSMQVGFGGFDTHGDHDNRHYFRIRDVLRDLHFLFRALEAYNIQDQTTVIVGSDFGRTPWYNDGNGKDHWAVTSYMLMGNHVKGGTQINATNALVEARDVRYDSGELTPVDGTSTRMTASHIHHALRKKAGIATHPFALQFPIEAEDIPIFG